MNRIFVVIILSFMLISSAFAVQFGGGKSLNYTASALTNAPGQLTIDSFLRGYKKSADITHSSFALAVNFGFTNRVEMGLIQVVGQEVQYGSNPAKPATYMSPGNTQFVFKYGNFQFKETSLYYMFDMIIGYRSASQYNLYLEPYYDYGISGRIDANFSYYTDVTNIWETPSYHFNVGYINYNDGFAIMESAQSIPFSLGYVMSDIKRDYSFELHGNFYTRRPGQHVYSRENYMYFCPGVKFKLFLGLNLGVALDVLVFTENETSEVLLPSGFPQYPTWRMNFKLGYSPSTAFYQIPTFEKPSRENIRQVSQPATQGFSPLSARRTITDKKSLFEWVVDENQGAQYIDLELEKIREERKRAEKELLKLKKEIDEVSKGK